MINLTITDVEKVLYHGEAASVTVPGSEGEMTILPHHTPIVSALKSGIITVREENEQKQFTITKGVIEISPKEVLILI
jgi:F-type H+-transporting ATPase subunit epsilon